MKAMKAKHDAAHKMMLQIQKTARAGETLNDVTRQTLLNWCEWFFSVGIISGKIY
jgi:RISC-loading complex subunit TARBP2